MSGGFYDEAPRPGPDVAAKVMYPVHFNNLQCKRLQTTGTMHFMVGAHWMDMAGTILRKVFCFIRTVLR